MRPWWPLLLAARSAMAAMMAAISLPLVCGCSAGAQTARVCWFLSAGHSTQLLAMYSMHLLIGRR